LYPPIYVFTADPHNWILQASLWLLRRHWTAPEMPEVVIAGYTRPDFALPDWATWHTIGRFQNYPIKKWSNALLEFLATRNDEQFIILLEDYFLTRDIDCEAIAWLAEFMAEHPQVMRMSMTTDRLYARGCVEGGPYHRLDMIYAPPGLEYQLSLMPSMWNKTQLLKYIIPDETPWDIEIAGTRRANEDGAIVYGTRQAPMQCMVAIRNGRFDIDTLWQVPPVAVSKDDRAELERLGYLSH